MSTWPPVVKMIPQFPQRQDSLTDQLRDLAPVADRMGCYGAADLLRAKVRMTDEFIGAARRLGLDTAEVNGDAAYDGSRAPQKRELTARERDVLSRVISFVIRDPRYAEEELDTLAIIREVVDPRRDDEPAGPPVIDSLSDIQRRLIKKVVDDSFTPDEHKR